MNKRQRERQGERRTAHAARTDNRRPKGVPLLSDERKRLKAERRKARKA